MEEITKVYCQDDIIPQKILVPTITSNWSDLELTFGEIQYLLYQTEPGQCGVTFAHYVPLTKEEMDR